MKFALILALFVFSSLASAEELCDVRPGESLGVKVIEFTSGNTIHSKMTLKETTPDALAEEIVNLQDMGVCAETIISKKCVLKFEKTQKTNLLTMYRGQDKWLSWPAISKNQAQVFVKSLQRVGFCS